MDKQYSVNMQDGEVVSVFVDGVEYTDVEEIGDPEDRAKVEQMIERMEKAPDDGFDPTFEQDFKAEFEKAQRQGANMGRLFALIFGGIGLLCLAIAVASAVGAVRQLGSEVEAPGEVVDVVLRRTRDSETNQLQEYYYPVVTFPAADGAQHEVQLDEGSWPAAYGVGDKVTVLYNSGQPRQVRIKSGASTLLLWLLPLITGVVGFVFTAVGVVVGWPKKHTPAWES